MYMPVKKKVMSRAGQKLLDLSEQSLRLQEKNIFACNILVRRIFSMNISVINIYHLIFFRASEFKNLISRCSMHWVERLYFWTKIRVQFILLPSLILINICIFSMIVVFYMCMKQLCSPESTAMTMIVYSYYYIIIFSILRNLCIFYSIDHQYLCNMPRCLIKIWYIYIYVYM